MNIKIILLLMQLFLISYNVQGSEINKKKIDTINQNDSNNDDELFKELTSVSKKYNYDELDPFIKYNKKMLSFNMFLFRNTMLPFIFAIDAWVPRPIKRGYINFMKNLKEPANYIIYGLNHNKDQMRLTAKRFFINTIFGLLGIIDVAGKKYDNHSKNISFDCAFRQKNKAGRYVILPITNQFYEREFTGYVFDWLTNPIFYLNFPLTYILYGTEQLITLASNKNLLYKYRKYSDNAYDFLRETETSAAFDNNSCIS